MINPDGWDHNDYDGEGYWQGYYPNENLHFTAMNDELPLNSVLLPDNVIQDLATMNDSGHTFKEIALYIENTIQPNELSNQHPVGV